MPLTLRPKNAILENILSSILSGNIVTDINSISIIRQLCEGVAASQADLDFDLWSLLQSFYIQTAEGQDLDLRGNDHGLARDPGQAASDPVTFYPLVTWVDDIPLPSPQVVQATLADGTQVLYRSLGDLILTPSGRSVSAQAPATTLTAGTNDSLSLNLDNDGVRTVTLGTQTTGTGIAAAIQAAVQALTALNPSHQSAYSQFRCDYATTVPGAYVLRSGTSGTLSSVVVSPSTAATALKLGLANGGIETVGQASLDVPVICDSIGVIGNVGAGQINELVGSVPGIDSVSNRLAFANGKEPASDDAYRQDIRSYLLGLGRGTEDALERAVMNTISPSDGQRHVQSAQTVFGAGNIGVYVCDGRSLTVGAQSDVVKDVQDELDGLGETVGGWVPSGNTAAVVAAVVLPINVSVIVTLGPMPDLMRAQQAIANVIYQTLYQWGVGQPLSYAQLSTRIDATVVEVFDIIFTAPSQFAGMSPQSIGGVVGLKLMPSVINVVVSRA